MALKDIDHIIFVMLENRSFDHMLGYLSLDETAGPIAVDGLRSGKASRDTFANAGDGTPYRVNRLSPTRKEKVDDPPHNKAAIRADRHRAGRPRPDADGRLRPSPTSIRGPRPSMRRPASPSPSRSRNGPAT